jgi:hypothetical protein
VDENIRQSGATFAGDQEYDEAHDATSSPSTGAAARERLPVQVDVPASNDGDYGYDMAHDMRR